MQSSFRFGSALLVGALAFGLSAGTAMANRAAGMVGQDLKVELSEWSLGFEEVSAPSGKIDVEFFNIGRAPHDFSVREASGKVIYRSRTLRGGEMGRADLNLAPGEYEVFCSVPGHERRGMVARLSVGQ
jgi:plastocyanin